MSKPIYDQADAESMTIRVHWTAERFALYGPTVLAFLDSVYDWAERKYALGQYIIETYEPDEILRCFATLGEVRKHCKLLREREEEIRNA